MVSYRVILFAIVNVAAVLLAVNGVPSSEIKYEEPKTTIRFVRGIEQHRRKLGKSTMSSMSSKGKGMSMMMKSMSSKGKGKGMMMMMKKKKRSKSKGMSGKGKGQYYSDEIECIPLPDPSYKGKGRDKKKMKRKMKKRKKKTMGKKRALVEGLEDAAKLDDFARTPQRELKMKKKKKKDIFSSSKGKGKSGKGLYLPPTFYCTESPSVAPTSSPTVPECTVADINATGFRFFDVTNQVSLDPIANTTYNLTELRAMFGTQDIGVECVTTGPVDAATVFDNFGQQDFEFNDTDAPFTLDFDGVATPWECVSPDAFNGREEWTVFCAPRCEGGGQGTTIQLSFTMLTIPQTPGDNICF